MPPIDLSKEVQELHESVQTLAALAIRARSRRHLTNDDQGIQIKAKLVVHLRALESKAGELRARLEDEHEGAPD